MNGPGRRPPGSGSCRPRNLRRTMPKSTRGSTRFFLRRPAEAVRQWEEALRLQPDLPGLTERIEQARREMAAGPATEAK